MIVEVRKTRGNGFIKSEFYSACAAHIGAPIDVKTGARKTGLTEKEERDLESEFNYDPGYLKRTSKFWDDYFVVIDADGATLDTSTPEGKLAYKVLQVNELLVAKSIKELSEKAEAQFVLIAEEEEAKVESVSVNKKMEAYGLLSGMSATERRQLMLIYGRKSDNMSDDAIIASLGREIEESPKLFLERAKDPDLKHIIFLNELRLEGIIERKGHALFFNETLLGADMEDSITFLKDKNNNEIVVNLKKLLVETTKKKK